MTPGAVRLIACEDGSLMDQWATPDSKPISACACVDNHVVVASAAVLYHLEVRDTLVLVRLVVHLGTIHGVDPLFIGMRVSAFMCISPLIPRTAIDCLATW